MSPRSRTSRPGFLLVLLALSLGACSKPQYIQPIESYLRPEPRDGAFLATLPMGTSCELLREVDEFWRHVRCQGMEGYVNPHDLGPRRPEAEELLAATKEPKQGPTERLELAIRAAVLAPGDAQVRATLKPLYLDYEFGELPPESDGAFAPEQPLDCQAPASPDVCLADALLPRKIFGSRRLVEHRGKTFVAVGVRDGYLYAVRGTSNAWADSPPAARSFVVRSQDFESLDVPLIADALGFKTEPGTPHSIQYTGNLERGYPRTMSGSRLDISQAGKSRVLIDLEKHLPPGPGKEIRRDLYGNIRLYLLFVGDFDQDGRDDALVRVSTMGNCCRPGYLFASTSRDGTPVVTKVFASAQQAPVLGEQDGLLTFTLRAEEGQQTYVLSRKQGRRVATQAYPVMETVFEYTAQQLWKLAEERHEQPGSTTQVLEYDLDDDGLAERIECRGWERWSALMCHVYREDRRHLGLISGCDRVGVLPDKTLGMHDLVCGRNIVVRWNGTTYP